MRVVVTGGSGKAGRAVVRDLLEHGYEVLNVDRVPSADSNSPDSPAPFLPADLVSRLKNSLKENQLAVAKTGEQPHPVFALMKREVRESLEAFLAQGGRKIDAWYAALKVVEVSFDDEADAFRNINTLEELKRE